MPFGGRVLRPLPGGNDPQPAAASSSSGLFSLTYEPYYGLKEKAFSLSADPRFLFRSPAHAPAFEELLNGIRRREGLITLTGEIGTGKTTLIRSVLQNLDRRTFSAFVPDPFVSREDLLKMLLVDFGVVSVADLKRGTLNGASRPDLSYPLYEFLDSLVPLQAFAVLIIDEAQNLPLPLLEEIRILSDLEGREKLLQVVLVGQPELRAHLKLPEMRQVDQRISVRCELTPLDREGVGGYVDHRLRVAGEGQVHVDFSLEAIDAIHEGSKGTPRLINLICDRALHRGFNARVAKIEAHFVWDAIADVGLEVARSEAAALEAAPPARPEPAKVEAPKIPEAKSRPAQPTAIAVPVPTPPPAPVQTRSASPVPQPHRELLSDFAPEPGTTSPSVNDGITRGWMLVAAASLVAVLALGGMFTYLQVQAMGELPSLSFPAAPKRPVETMPAVMPPGGQHFTIQVASFETLAPAERMVARLTSAGYQARAIERTIIDGRSIVEVLVGDYRTTDEANAALPNLRSVHGFFDAQVEPIFGADLR